MKGLGELGVSWDRVGTYHVIFPITHDSFPNSLLEYFSLLRGKNADEIKSTAISLFYTHNLC